MKRSVKTATRACRLFCVLALMLVIGWVAGACSAPTGRAGLVVAPMSTRDDTAKGDAGTEAAASQRSAVDIERAARK